MGPYSGAPHVVLGWGHKEVINIKINFLRFHHPGPLSLLRFSCILCISITSYRADDDPIYLLLLQMPFLPEIIDPFY